MHIERYNPTSSHSHRAAQAWVILVATAMNRQYRRNAQGVLDKILGKIAVFCKHELPALTTLVVGKSRGTPGKEIPDDRNRIDELREEVYAFDWFDVRPPTPDEIKTFRLDREP
jgi:hypothetical protein